MHVYSCVRVKMKFPFTSIYILLIQLLLINCQLLDDKDNNEQLDEIIITISESLTRLEETTEAYISYNLKLMTYFGRINNQEVSSMMSQSTFFITEKKDKVQTYLDLLNDNSAERLGVNITDCLYSFQRYLNDGAETFITELKECRDWNQAVESAIEEIKTELEAIKDKVGDYKNDLKFCSGHEECIYETINEIREDFADLEITLDEIQTSRNILPLLFDKFVTECFATTLEDVVGRFDPDVVMDGVAQLCFENLVTVKVIDVRDVDVDVDTVRDSDEDVDDD